MLRISRLLLVSLVAVAFGLGSLPAQVTGRSNPAPTAPVAAVDPTTGQLVDPPKDVGPRLDFEFDNLPLEEVIKRVQASYHQESGKYLNVMVPQQMRDVARTNLISLEVRQVTVGELFDLFGRASERNVEFFQNVGRGASQFVQMTTGYKFEPVSAGGDNLTYLLKGEYPPERPKQAEPVVVTANAPNAENPPKEVQFYQLDPYLDRFTVEDITTAIKTGADLAGYNGAPTMKYHEETKLLVVHGTQPQVGLVQQVLRSLANAKRPAGQPVPVQPVNPESRPVPVSEPQPFLPPGPAKP